MRYLVIADDLTGALEIGVLARCAGWRSLVLRHGTPLRLPDAQFPVVVVDSGTREVTAGEAHEAIRLLLGGVPDEPGTVLLKKTDSLLRGNIAAELAVLAESRPQRQLVYVPAYPLMGRSVVGARLRAHGIEDLPWNGDLRAMLGGLPPAQALRVISDEAELRGELADGPGQQEPGASCALLVCDAEQQSEVDALAVVLREAGWPVMTAGPSGVFREFFPKPATCVPAVSVPRLTTGVAFVGSQHPVSVAQCEAAIKAGRVVAARAESGDFVDYRRQWQEACTEGAWLLLQAAGELVAAPEMRFGLLAGDRDGLPRAMYFSGGSTADACLRAMGCAELEPLSELLPGVVLSEARVGSAESGGAGAREEALQVITKSGAFGDEHTLVELLAMLQGKP